jgi:hypothetical protein
LNIREFDFVESNVQVTLGSSIAINTSILLLLLLLLLLAVVVVGGCCCWQLLRPFSLIEKR